MTADISSVLPRDHREELKATSCPGTEEWSHFRDGVWNLPTRGGLDGVLGRWAANVRVKLAGHPVRARGGQAAPLTGAWRAAESAPVSRLASCVQHRAVAAALSAGVCASACACVCLWLVCTGARHVCLVRRQLTTAPAAALRPSPYADAVAGPVFAQRRLAATVRPVFFLWNREPLWDSFVSDGGGRFRRGEAEYGRCCLWIARNRNKGHELESHCYLLCNEPLETTVLLYQMNLTSKFVKITNFC
ncbi:uncharacterized protein LOC126456292 [Schistocerca serialis cubense]|uniref:uncharacterized protein LOC126456292 n=1 Tax=Schistocerca serialis cubense TaxID=2023355 RepID=UPI00214E420D|nr:uncharacterized protein LOC126456292 [Schistocerca serialis cubense]